MTRQEWEQIILRDRESNVGPQSPSCHDRRALIGAVRELVNELNITRKLMEAHGTRSSKVRVGKLKDMTAKYT